MIAFYRNGSSVNNVGSNGNYWSSTPNDANNAYNLNFNSGNVNPANNNNRYNGQSVRLVQASILFVSVLLNKKISIIIVCVMVFEDIYKAYCDARKNKRRTRSQVLFEMNLEKNIAELYKDLSNGSYKIGRSMCFVINDPVKREVFAAAFRDRIVHHYVYNIISPLLDKKFIFDSYSCREGKGTLKAVERLEHHIRSCSFNYTKEAWVLKLDIKGYFMSINRQILYDRLISMLPSDVISEIGELLKLIVFNDPIKGCKIKGKRSDWEGLPETKSMFHAKNGCGLPIGNLTSQLFSNVYLSLLDDFVKRELKIKHYGRYVDDFYLVHDDKEYLKMCIEQIDDFLKEKLQLQLHPKKIYLQKVSHGVMFMGVMVKPYRRYVSKRTIKKMLSVFQDIDEYTPKELQAKINSYFGYLSHTSSQKIVRRFINDHQWIRLYGTLSERKLKLSYSSKYLFFSMEKKRISAR